MKNTILLAFLLFLFSCRKELAEDKKFTVLDEFPTETITKDILNDKKYSWKANVFAKKRSLDSTKFNFSMGTFQDKDQLSPREGLSIFAIPFKKGKYKMSSNTIPNPTGELVQSLFSRYVDDGHIDCWYHIDEQENNYVCVKSIDEKNRTMKVKFEIYFILEEEGLTGPNPEKIHFCNADFEVKY